MPDALTRNLQTPTATPQTEPIRGREAEMAKNNAGGYTFALDKWAQLRRFLILGTDGGTYYVDERKHTQLNAAVVDACIAEDGPRTISEIVDVSTRGLAPKNNQAIYALAVAASSDDVTTRQLANDAIGSVCRIGTHLYLFAEYMRMLGRRGWGRGLRRGVARALNGDVSRLAFHAVKYRQREGWTYRDLLRLSHAYDFADKDDQDGARRVLFDFMCGRGDLDAVSQFEELRVVEGFIRMNDATDAATAAALIKEYGLPWEAVPDGFRKDAAMWAELLPGMPAMALTRNLSQLSRLGLLKPLGEFEKLIVGRLTDPEYIRRSKAHPIAFLNANRVHASGGTLGRGRGETYDTNTNVVAALDEAFSLAFENVEPSGKRFYLGLDVSGSMSQPVSGSAVITCAEGAAAMALVTARTEPYTHAVGFTAGRGGWLTTGLTEIPMDGRSSLDSVLTKTRGVNFGMTDCSLPMVDALERGLEVDVFAVYTDSETYAGNIQPSEALVKYRKETGIPARLVVVGMTSTGFSIADPADAGMMDVVGFDASTPRAISLFSSGEV
jgi:60 kDa SS-A/Ro ribonucleoprotein